MWTFAHRSVGARIAVPVAICMLCVPFISVAADADPATSQDAQSAVWTQKELIFTYMGFTTKYSCDGLQDKMRTALLQLGAMKKDLKVRQMACSSSFGRPDPFPGVRVKMSILQPATDATSGDKQAVVAAHWQPVELKLDDVAQYSGSGNCELVEQIKSKVVPVFATRNIQYQSNCIPHQATVGGTTLKLEVLVPDQKEPAKAAKTKAASG